MRRTAALVACAAILTATAAASAGDRGDQLAQQLKRERAAWAVERAGLRRLARASLYQGSVDEALRLASVTYGVPLHELRSVAWCESTHRPLARNGRYRGLFQEGPMFEAGPFGRAGLSVWSPYANAMTAAYTVSREGWRQWQCRPGGGLAW